SMLSRASRATVSQDRMSLRQRARSTTLGSLLTSRSLERDPMPYLSWTPTIGRNSAFVDLSEEQREELGGIEYRALKTLAFILVGMIRHVQFSAVSYSRACSLLRRLSLAWNALSTSLDIARARLCVHALQGGSQCCLVVSTTSEETVLRSLLQGV